MNKRTIIVTGSGGLIGSEACRYFHASGYMVIGIDNDMRAQFFGSEASTQWNISSLQETLQNYIHINGDIRSPNDMDNVFNDYSKNIIAVIHTAAQPSHDWAAKDPMKDFTVNANGTLNMLEMTRKYCPEAVFVFTSTNKVYGDNPNLLPLVELEDRWEISDSHQWYRGIPETMSIDHCKHSLFGVSKAAADLMVQEYGRYFKMNTVVFRGGCLTGPAHSATKLHGFLAYLMKCIMTEEPYTVLGYKGKQVRDNIHAYDLIRAFDCVINKPKQASVYNIGGGRKSNCSMKEAILICEEITGKQIKGKYDDNNRIGDHIWYISDLTKFRTDYPEWDIEYTIEKILSQIFEMNKDRWRCA